MKRLIPLMILVLAPACKKNKDSGTDGPKDDPTGPPPVGSEATGGDTGGTGEPTPAPNDFTLGNGGHCVVLYGASDRVIGPDTGMPFGNEARTLQAWVRTGWDAHQVAASYGRASVGQGFAIGVIDGFAFVDTAGTDKVIGSTFIADDTWHHVIGAWDGTTAAIMVDGVQDGAGLLTGDTLAGSTTIGNYPEGSNDPHPWVGWVDEVRVFRGARPPGQVAKDLEGDAFLADLAVWYTFDELVGTPEGANVAVADQSGNGLDAQSGGGDDRPKFLECR